MIQPKRITLFAGHYGSGKTSIAVNYALYLRRLGKQTVICDLDIVNPYFRTKDSEHMLKSEGVELISSKFANSNVDLPALPQETYGIFCRKDKYAVIDVGGDDRGALALGRYVPYILKEGDYAMLFVANCYRPLTRNASDAFEVMREIEGACGIAFTGVVNNSNIGNETSPEDIVASFEFAEELCGLSSLPLAFTSFDKNLSLLPNCKENEVFPLVLDERYYDIRRN